MLGDAFAFVDPVFSSGVYLAMHSAFDGADVVAAALDRPRARPRAARRRFERYMQHGPREFSWFIFRVTNPTMREFFMYPQNPFRVKEALMSLLAGDIYGKTPIWRSLRVLKALYYLVSVGHPRRTWRAWRRRRSNIRDLGPLVGRKHRRGQVTRARTSGSPPLRVERLSSGAQPRHSAAERPSALRRARLRHARRPGVDADRSMRACCPPPARWPTSGTPASTSSPAPPASCAGAATGTGCSAPSTSTKPSKSSGLAALAQRAYRDLFEALEQTGCAHLLRVWNYLPQINADGGGLERYRQFNAGRQQAFIEAGQAAFEGAPAACALGIHQGALCIRFLAGRVAPLPIENPRQVSAYRYPPTYGPRAPTFSRAALAETGRRRRRALHLGHRQHRRPRDGAPRRGAGADRGDAAQPRAP